MATTKRQPDAKAPDADPAGREPERPEGDRKPVEFIAVQQRRNRLRRKLRKFH
jgi:hypothetical protein